MSRESSAGRASTARRIAGTYVAVAVAASLWGCSRTDGPTAANFATSDGQLLVRAKSIRWGPAPPSFPAGAKAALLQGNPAASGPFVIRLQLPAKYKIAFHSYAKPQDVTVMSGTLFVASTETFDKKKAFSIKPGDFYHLPGQASQFLFTKDETVIEIHGDGPYELKYSTASDDPLKGGTLPPFAFQAGFNVNEIKMADADAIIDMTY